jgi:hypothetical protein
MPRSNNALERIVKIGLVPLEPDDGRLVAHLERRTPLDS